MSSKFCFACVIRWRYSPIHKDSYGYLGYLIAFHWDTWMSHFFVWICSGRCFSCRRSFRFWLESFLNKHFEFVEQSNFQNMTREAYTPPKSNTDPENHQQEKKSSTTFFLYMILSDSISMDQKKGYCEFREDSKWTYALVMKHSWL